jgi:hypothetical protein
MRLQMNRRSRIVATWSLLAEVRGMCNTCPRAITTLTFMTSRRPSRHPQLIVRCDADDDYDNGAALMQLAAWMLEVRCKSDECMLESSVTCYFRPHLNLNAAHSRKRLPWQRP